MMQGGTGRGMVLMRGRSSRTGKAAAARGMAAGLAEAAARAEGSRSRSPAVHGDGDVELARLPLPGTVEGRPSSAPEAGDGAAAGGAAGGGDGAAAGLHGTSKWTTLRNVVAASHRPRELEVKAQIHDMVVYLIFLSLFTFVTLSGRNEQALYWTSTNLRGQMTEVELPFASSQVKKTFEDVATVEELYYWVEGPLWQALYSASTFDGDHNFTDTSADGNRPGFLLGHGRVIGGVRFSQLRVKPDSCESQVPPVLRALDRNITCYPALSPQSEDTSSFGPGDIYKFVRADEPVFQSENSRWYPPPGAGIVAPNPRGGDAARERAREVFFGLRRNHFVDLRSRVMFVDFFVYNANLDVTTSVRLVAEFLVSGGVLTSAEMQTLRLWRYYRTSDYIRAAMELAVLCFVLYYIYDDSKKVRREGLRYFREMTNYPHILNLLLFLFVWAYRLQFLLSLPYELDASPTAVLPLRWPMFYLDMSKDINSFNAFLSWLKVFKYLAFIPKFGQLTRTLKNSVGGVSGFMLIFLLTMFASSQSALLAFGTNVYEYRNMSTSFFSLIRALLGDFNFEELRKTNQVLGPAFFMSFMVFAVFVLLNMFIAIISDAYSETKAYLEVTDDMPHIGREIVNYVVHNFLYRVPLLGPLLRKTVEGVDRLQVLAKAKGAAALNLVARRTGSALGFSHGRLAGEYGPDGASRRSSTGSGAGDEEAKAEAEAAARALAEIEADAHLMTMAEMRQLRRSVHSSEALLEAAAADRHTLQRLEAQQQEIITMLQAVLAGGAASSAAGSPPPSPKAAATAPLVSVEPPPAADSSSGSSAD